MLHKEREHVSTDTLRFVYSAKVKIQLQLNV